MLVHVTDHAVEQYRKKLLRFYDYDVSNKEIKAELILIARKGKRRRQPSLPGQNVFEHIYNGLSVSVECSKKEATIITFNGDRRWRGWWKKKNTRLRGMRKAVAAL